MPLSLYLFYFRQLVRFLRSSSHLPPSSRILLKFIWCCIDTVTVWKSLRFILLDKSDFHMFNKLSIAVYSFRSRMSTSLSVDEILLPMYGQFSINFREDFSSLKTQPMAHHLCTMLCSRKSAWASVYARRARSSA